MCAGEISAMYAGAMTEAIPTPTPPTKRQRIRSHTVNAMPEPIALIANKNAPRASP